MMPINGSLYEILGEQAGVCRGISPYPIPTLPVVASPVISGQYDWCSNALLMYECSLATASALPGCYVKVEDSFYFAAGATLQVPEAPAF